MNRLSKVEKNSPRRQWMLFIFAPMTFFKIVSYCIRWLAHRINACCLHPVKICSLLKKNFATFLQRLCLQWSEFKIVETNRNQFIEPHNRDKVNFTG